MAYVAPIPLQPRLHHFAEGMQVTPDRMSDFDPDLDLLETNCPTFKMSGSSHVGGGFHKGRGTK